MKAYKIILLILLIAILIRCFGLNQEIYDDEANYTFAAVNAESLGFNPYYYSPILAQWLNIASINLLGIHIWSFRLVQLILGVITIFIIYLLAKEHYNEKVALFTSLIMAISFYHILASLQIDVEGSILTLLFALAFFSYLKYEKYKFKKWQILTGLFLGLSFLAKSNAINLFLIIGIYSLIKNKNIIKSLKELWVPFVLGICLMFLFLLFFYAINPENITFLLSHGTNFLNIKPTIDPLIIFLIWATPLLVIPAFIRIIKPEKKDSIFIIWIIYTLIFYSFIIKKGDFSRYFMNLIPALAILSANTFSKINFKNLKLIAFLTTIYLTLLFLITLIPIKYIPRFFELYLSEVKNFNFNFLFSYTTSSGPLFGVSFLTITLTWIIALITLLFYLFIKNKNIRTICLILILSTGLAFNIFLSQEYLFHSTSPNPSFVQKEMISYFKSHNLPYPIYSNNEGLLYELDNQYWISNRITLNKSYGLPDNELDADITKNKEFIKNRGGTILLLNWPPISEKSPVWEVTKLCKKQKSFYSKSIILGEIYSC